MLRTPITLTAAALAAALALSACGTVRLGAAAVTNTSRIPTATVSAEVNNLDAAYKADKAKVQLQFPASQMPQQVLSWLLRFRVREQMAAAQPPDHHPQPGPGGPRVRGRPGQAERGHAHRAGRRQRGAAGPAHRARPVRGDPEPAAGPAGRRDAADRLRGAADAGEPVQHRTSAGRPRAWASGQPAVRAARLQPGLGGPRASKLAAAPAPRSPSPSASPTRPRS